jgi:large subunit ribosomal protein L22
MAWQATHKYARISSRKVKLVLDMIRGLDVQDALTALKFSPNRAASLITVVLTSAVANANELQANVDQLVVSKAIVGEGPTIKRFRPKDRGRAHPINKRTSHITVEVDER